MTSVQWSIGTSPFANTYTGTAATSDTLIYTTDSLCFVFCTIESDSFSIPNINLGAGTYYLTLQNGIATGEASAAWDLINGPSTAYLDNIDEPFVGSSNSFDIVGTTNAITPEPGYLALLSGAIVGLAWLKVRRFSNAKR